MNRTRMMVVGLAALVVSLIVTLWVYRELSGRLTGGPKPAREIVVAAKNVSMGAILKAEDLKTIPWPGDVDLAGSFGKIDDAVGRGAILPLAANEPVLEARLAPKGSGGLTAAIPEGMRALAVKVNDVVGVAGFAVPGTRVDVVLSGSPEGNDFEFSKTILENVQVLSAGQDVEIDREGKPKNVQVITLLLTPEQAQKLALGSIDGQIRLALRNPMDQKVADPAPVSKKALYQQGEAEAPPKPAPRRVARAAPPPPVAAEPPPPKQFEVELIRGADREKLVFEERKPN